MAEIMFGKDSISGALGECFLTIDGNRYNFMQAIKIEATIEKKKMEVPILGKTGKGNKGSSWSGQGVAEFHFNTTLFRDLWHTFAKTGKDVYFDMVITNDDPTSDAGRQTVILKDCNLNDGVIAKIDASKDFLTETFRFTFEDFEIPQKFNSLKGMQV